jgi:PAS domain S-box-containing protein
VIEPVRVLLVEDSATDAKLVLQTLKKLDRPIVSHRVQDEPGLRAALTDPWDVVICDWSMPRFSATAALSVLKELALDLPLVIVSGTVGEESAVEAMRAGARDYVLKDRLGRHNAVVERERRESQERSARRRAESALRESEARLSKLSASGIIGILIADLDGTALDANDAFLRLTGYSRDQLGAGALRRELLTPYEWRELDVEAMEQLKTSGVVQPWERELVRRDGSYVPVLTGAAMLDARRYIMFAADLTAQQRAEQAKAILAIKVEHEQVGRERAERALLASEEQLRQAQKMEAVGRLAGGVAHDFNNVLSVILSYAELMMNDLPEADPMRKELEEIHKAAERAAGLTRQLLLFSRQKALELKVVDLNEVLGSMDKMLRRLLGEDVELVARFAKNLGRVRANPSHVEQVVMNLVVNARDAMPTGGKVTISTANVVLDESHVATQPLAKPGPHVVLTVTDTGIGMDHATQVRIFEPFFTTKEQSKGTGLGLSTVFGIVQQSGGHIWVHSELGQGTTFKIYLPVVEAELDVSRPAATIQTLRGNETILLVEDEQQVRDIALGILRRHGYLVIAAQHASEALLMCEKYQHTIHLLLTDVVMPQMSGPELAKRLSALRPKMKVLCMSGYTDDSVARHGVTESGIAFFQKPITPASLTRKVREVLDGSTS